MSDERPDAESGTTSTGHAAAPEAGPGSSGRRVLAGLFWLLASLAIMVAGVTLWAHQTLLTSDGWTGIVAEVAADPEVIEATSARVVDRLSEALGVQEIVANVLPGDLDIVAAAVTSGLEDRVTDRLAELATSEGFQDAFLGVNRAGHAAAMRVIRGGDSEALASEEGTISLNVFPLIEGALVALQDAGLIDESREIPDLSTYEPPAETVARLESALGRDLPDDLGTITLVDSERLGRLQSAVRAFDVITIVLIIVAMACIAIALWLSARRVRMVLWLAIGAVAALALGRAFTRLIVEDLTGELQASASGTAVRAVVESAVDSLMWFTFAVIVVALVVAGLALWAERRAAAAQTVESGPPQAARAWLRARAQLIGAIGIGLIAFVVVWNLGGPDITLMASALVGIVLIAVSLLAGQDEKEELATVRPPGIPSVHDAGAPSTTEV